MSEMDDEIQTLKTQLRDMTYERDSLRQQVESYKESYRSYQHEQSVCNREKTATIEAYERALRIVVSKGQSPRDY